MIVKSGDFKIKWATVGDSEDKLFFICLLLSSCKGSNTLCPSYKKAIKKASKIQNELRISISKDAGYDGHLKSGI